MKLLKAFESKKFILEVTMPQTIEYVDAALAGGAQALKLRCNQEDVGGFSNGVYNGPFATRKDFIREAVEHAGKVPVGLVPGRPGNVLTLAERTEMEEIGVDYLNCDPTYLPPYMMESSVTKVLCLTYENRTPELIRWLDEDPKVDVVEVGLLPHSEFGKQLSYHDIMYYRDIASRIHKPMIATAERHILPEEIHYLYDAGMNSLMIGLSVFYEFLKNEGGALTPDFVKRVTAQYREAIEKL